MPDNEELKKLNERLDSLEQTIKAKDEQIATLTQERDDAKTKLAKFRVDGIAKQVEPVKATDNEPIEFDIEF